MQHVYFFTMKEKDQNSSLLNAMSPFRSVPEDAIKSFGYGFIKRFLMILFVIFCFILSLQVIKTSIGAETKEFFKSYTDVYLNNPFKAFSFGWLGTVFVLSGSPIASIGVSLFSVSAINSILLNALILGSRSGPDMVLFIVGLVTFIKKRSIRHTLGLGLVEFLTTFTTVLGMAILSPFVINSPLNLRFASLFQKSTTYADFISTYFQPFSETIVSYFPSLVALFVGIGLLVVAIFLFDKFFTLVHFDEQRDSTVHETLKEHVSQLFHHPFLAFKNGFLKIFTAPSRFHFRWKLQDVLQHPLFAFFMGAVITAITMSTAISVGILVPFYAYRVINIRSVVPYVLAANITTFIDTLFVAILTGNLEAVQVVTSLILSSLFFVILAGIFFKYYLYFIDRVSHLILRKPIFIFFFLILTIGIPLGIILW